MISTVESVSGAFYKLHCCHIEDDNALKYIEASKERQAKERIEEWKAKIKLYPLTQTSVAKTA